MSPLRLLCPLLLAGLFLPLGACESAPPREGRAKGDPPRIHLIVGAVGERSARVWVRDDRPPRKGQTLRVSVSSPGAASFHRDVLLDLPVSGGGVLELHKLTPGQTYSLHFTTQGGRRVQGSFRTLGGPPAPYTFALLSCNKNLTGSRNLSTAADLCSARRVSFVVHCGDQIYYDHEGGAKPPSRALYRQRYDQTWGADEGARRLLSRHANYMILDDHDIANDFNDARKLSDKVKAFPVRAHLEQGLPAYQDFQRSHGPPSPEGKHYYTFSSPGAEFFVMDVRLDRLPHRPEATRGEMISPQQLAAVQTWLSKHKARLKFVVTPLPFVGQVSFLTKRFAGDPKWDSKRFQGQRRALLKFIAKRKLGRLVFLTGDMHASYLATLAAKPTRRGPAKTLAYELMSSPVAHPLKAYLGWGLRNRPKTLLKLETSSLVSDIGKIHAKTSMTLITIDPARHQLSFEILGLAKGRSLQKGTLTW